MMAPEGSELIAGTLVLLLILVAAAILVPGALGLVTGEWAEVIAWAAK